MSAAIKQRAYTSTMRVLDTPNLDLYRTDGRSVTKMDGIKGFFAPEIVVKTKGEVLAGGVLSREEHTTVLPSEEIDFSQIKIPRALELLSIVDHKSLSQIFYYEDQRRDLRGAFNNAVGNKTAVLELSTENTNFIDGATKTSYAQRYEFEIEFKGRYSDSEITYDEAAALVPRIAARVAEGIEGARIDTQNKKDFGFIPYLKRLNIQQ